MLKKIELIVTTFDQIEDGAEVFIRHNEVFYHCIKLDKETIQYKDTEEGFMTGQFREVYLIVDNSKKKKEVRHGEEKAEVSQKGVV